MIGTVVNMCNKKGKKQQQSGDQDEPEMANVIIVNWKALIMVAHLILQHSSSQGSHIAVQLIAADKSSATAVVYASITKVL